MKRKYIIALCCVVLVLVLGWLLWPTLVVSSLHFVEEKGEEASRKACDRIVAVGPRVIPAIIRSIKRNSPWVRRHCYLPIALRELGQPARNALLESIDSEADPKVREYLISTLQTGFRDFRRFDLWLKDAQAGRVSPWSMSRFMEDIRSLRLAGPDLMTDRKLNPDFIVWWNEHKAEIISREHVAEGSYTP